MVTLSSFAEGVGLQRVDVIKLDVVGADYVALKGAEPLITTYRPKIAI